MFRAMLLLVLSMGGAVLTAEEFTAEGTVNAVRLKEQKINITHGSITGLTGEATRDFLVQDPGMLEELQAGNKIRFSVGQASDGALVITDFEVMVAPLPKPSHQKK